LVAVPVGEENAQRSALGVGFAVEEIKPRLAEGRLRLQGVREAGRGGGVELERARSTLPFRASRSARSASSPARSSRCIACWSARAAATASDLAAMTGPCRVVWNNGRLVVAVTVTRSPHRASRLP
jgi:hypothetical protein